MPGVFALQQRNHPPHIADRGGSDLGNGRCNRAVNLACLQLTRQKFFDNPHFCQFFHRQFHPPAVFKGASTFLALLHHPAQNGQDIGITDLGIAAVTAVGNLAVFDGSVDQSQGGQAVRLTRAHGLFQRRLQAISQCHWWLHPHRCPMRHITML